MLNTTTKVHYSKHYLKDQSKRRPTHEDEYKAQKRQRKRDSDALELETA